MIILKAIYFALPIYLGNSAPVFMKWLPFGGQPLDGGKMYKGERLLGKNKTWRGLFVAIIFGILSIYLQRYLQQASSFFASISLFDYQTNKALLLGGLMGFGAIVGDAVKSFFKRRYHHKPGSPWFPFDQLDLVIGGLALSVFIYWPGYEIVIILILVTPLLHFLANYLSYKVGIKDVPW